MNKRFTDKVDSDFIRPQKLIKWKLSVEARGIGRSVTYMGHFGSPPDEGRLNANRVYGLRGSVIPAQVYI